MSFPSAVVASVAATWHPLLLLAVAGLFTRSRGVVHNYVTLGAKPDDVSNATTWANGAPLVFPLPCRRIPSTQLHLTAHTGHSPSVSRKYWS